MTCRKVPREKYLRVFMGHEVSTVILYQSICPVNLETKENWEFFEAEEAMECLIRELAEG